MKILCFDTETTGLDSNVDEVLQFSAITNDGFEFNQYYKPEHHDSWEQAMSVHGITPDFVADKPKFASEDNVARLQQMIDEADLLVGYNLIFDVGFLEKVGIRCDHKPQFDVMRVFAPIYGEWSDNNKAWRWKKLIVCADYYGYEWGENGAHDALGDVKATLHCYEKMTRRWRKNEQ